MREGGAPVYGTKSARTTGFDRSIASRGVSANWPKLHAWRANPANPTFDQLGAGAVTDDREAIHRSLRPRAEPHWADLHEGRRARRMDGTGTSERGRHTDGLLAIGSDRHQRDRDADVLGDPIEVGTKRLG